METEASSTRETAALADTVISIIAEVTRYPKNILRPEAELEEELGIESVKRAEILGVLSTRLGLPAPAQGSETQVGKLRTIGDVVTAVETLMAQVPEGQDVGSATVLAVAGGPQSIPASDRASTPERALPRLASRVAAPAARPAPPPIPPRIPLPSPARPGPAARRAPPALPVRTVPPVRPPLARFTPPRPAVSRATPDRPFADRPFADRPFADRPFADQPFADRVVLVTGSGHGIGRILAGHLAHLGARVIVNSFHSREAGESTASELVAAGYDAVHIWGSVANAGQLQDIFATIEARFGQLDFLVSAASNARRGPLFEITPEDWERAFKTEVVALHQAALAAAPLMDRAGGGKIVAVTHPGTQRVFPDFGCAGSVKAAVESLARYLAIELGPRGIQVNALSAGPIPAGPGSTEADDLRLRAWAARVPGMRLPDPTGIAGALAFLLSGAANMVNGATLVVDGGLSVVL